MDELMWRYSAMQYAELREQLERVIICPNCKSENNFIAHSDDTSFNLVDNCYYRTMVVRCVACGSKFGTRLKITDNELKNHSL